MNQKNHRMKKVIMIPARSGSKRIKKKNLRLLSGKPLIAYTMETAARTGLPVYVNSDCNIILSLAKNYGCIPYKRDKSLCTDSSTNDEFIGNLLSSTRSHGRPFDSIYFDHQRTGLNSKMNDMEASIGLEAIEVFWDTFWTRHSFMKRMREACIGYEDVAWFSEEDEENINCPHGFSITCKKEGDIEIVKQTLDKYNIHHKRNFGSIPTQQAAFADMGYELGDFPESEWVGDNGVHIGCHQYLTEENMERICTALQEALEKMS